MSNRNAQTTVAHAKTVITLQKFAKELWGEHQDIEYMQHYIPARGYPGEKISHEERKKYIDPLMDNRYSYPQYLYSCVNCKKDWAKCLNTNCKQIKRANTGYKLHLALMVTSDNPTEYLKENAGLELE